jgi:hypothetical protein
MDIDRKKLIDRIVKWLPLAASSDFSDEAATTKSLAAELLAKHNIAAFELKDGRRSKATRRDGSLHGA